MRARRRQLQHLNSARAVAITALLVAAFSIEVLFAPQKSLHRLYVLSAGGYGSILLYALLDRWLGERRVLAAVQVAGDTLLVAAFVLVSGGALSPVSFLFALPVMVGGALWGLRGGVVTGGAAWAIYGAMLVHDLLGLPTSEIPRGVVVYAGVSHLVGFLLLGALGGFLADRLRVADRELAEHKDRLAALRAQHAEIVESIDTGLLTADDEGRVAFINPAALRIVGRSEGDLRGTLVTDLFGLPRGFLSEVGETQRRGQRCRFERRWRRQPDGDELLLGFTISRLAGRSGAGDGWLVVFQDLTEIASLEAQVRTRERMAALGEMAAGMAHELRNPLAAISGCVQMIGAAESPERQALGEVALRETDRLNRIIRDFLDFARPAPFNPRPLDLLPLMEELARLLRKSPDFKAGHKVEVVASPGSTRAKADPDRLRQVFWNLASNALKAMPAGGNLVIEVGGYAGDQVQLSFRDQGEGMSEEMLERLFEPFQGRFREGAGLGAAIVYRIVEEHGGRVQVVSRPARGTEIRVILPAAAELAELAGVGAVES